MTAQNPPETDTEPWGEMAVTEALADAVAGLPGLASMPTAAHVPVFERVHVALTEALSAIDGV